MATESPYPAHASSASRFLSIVCGVLGGCVVGLAILLVWAVIRLEHVQHQQAVTQKASTATRVVTVGQRCGLTQDLEALTTLDRNVLLHFVPPRYGQAEIVAPYDKRLQVEAKSYMGCEKQLVQVIRINARTPNP